MENESDALEWRHNGVMVSQITGNSTTEINNNETSKLYITILWEGNHRLQVDSPHKRPVMLEVFPGHHNTMEQKLVTI